MFNSDDQQPQSDPIYHMKLHETIIAADARSLFTEVLRVPGGWIYQSFDKSTQVMGMVFVPWHNEFQP